MNLKVGSKVSNRAFGEGVVLNLYDTYADVQFEKAGKRSIVYTALNEIEENNLSKCSKKINKFLILDTIYNYFCNKNIIFADFDKILDELKEKISPKISFELVNPLVHIVSNKLYKGEIKHELYLLRLNLVENTEINLIEEEEKQLNESNVPNIIHETFSQGVDNFSEFKKICSIQPFYDTSKLYVAKCIIDHFKDAKLILDSDFEYKIDDLIYDFLNCYLYQNSCGNFNNGSSGSNLQFIEHIRNSAEDNVLTDEEKSYLKSLIYTYLVEKGLKPFTNISLISFAPNGRMIFDRISVIQIKKQAKTLNTSIINRLSYFLCTRNNTATAQVKNYISGLRKELYKNNFVLAFEFQNQLDEMSKVLDKDFYLKQDFKNLMKEYGIPSTDNYLRMCLARIDYELRTKKIILKSKYTSFKAYLKELVLKEDVYRYSNPHDLDEYDNSLNSLVNDLVLIHYENDVYLTKKNMEKNGVNDIEIQKFNSCIDNLAKTKKIFSINDIAKNCSENKIIDYCDGSKYQLLQFILPNKSIQLLRKNKSGAIFASNNIKNPFDLYVKILMNYEDSKDIYELKDNAFNLFGIEYDIEDMIKDVNKSSLFYSEELEKVYKYKSYYLREVYEDDN